jgi:hypothetical protein
MTLENTTPNLNSDHLHCNGENGRTSLVNFTLGIPLQEKGLLAKLGLDTV